QIAILTEWIARGATYPDTKQTRPAQRDASTHWSFQPLKLPPIPSVADHDAAQNPIDHFVMARLKSQGLTLTQPADKYSLLRRVTYDLTGLPPTEDEVDLFLADDSPTAYANAVDRLLCSPRHGERWGRHWLDLVRYADDFEEAWRYRDWVVSAWNHDLGYD